MSSRDANCTIHNNTPLTMSLASGSFEGEDNPYVKDGQINAGPPSSISANSTGTLNVGKTSNASLSGPEGWVYYQLNNGPETLLVKLYWNHPDDDSASVYDVVPMDSRIDGSTSPSSPSGKDQTISYYVNYTPTPPNDWDMVLGMSQGMINAGLKTMFGHKTTFQAPTVAGAPTDNSTWLGLDVKKMDMPKVKILSGGGSTVELWLWFNTATLYYSTGGQRSSMALSNVQAVLTVNLKSAQAVDDAAVALMDPTTQAQIDGLKDSRFTVWSIYLDLRNPSLMTSLRLLDSNGNPLTWTTDQLTTFKQALTTWVNSNPPAPLIGLGKPPTVTTPALAPTSFEYNTTYYAASEDASTLNVFCMTSGRASPVASSWRSRETLDAYLARHGVVAITGIDTRKLTRHLRDHGSQNGAIGVASTDVLVRQAREARNMNGLDLVREVTPKEPYVFTEGRREWRVGEPKRESRHVVAMDFGLKRNILRCLVDAGCKVTVVPATWTAEQILDLSPDGVFLSNGPGDPAAVTYAIETARALLGKKPMFGICLGHQILSLALGATTYKLKFGHRGVNQPVLDLTTGKVEITTQNHGFAVELHSLAGKAETTHVHLNDRTSEGLATPSQRAFSVQSHPEAAAGPHDALYLFERFTSLIDASR